MFYNKDKVGGRKYMKNTKPKVMDDKGPRGETRAKSIDGKYTANPNSSAEYVDPYPNIKPTYKRYRKQSYAKIDERIIEPMYESMMKDIVRRVYGEDGLVVKSTRFEDEKLGIDYFIGVPGKEKAILILDNNVMKVDLKARIKYMDDENFYNNPKIKLTLYKEMRDGYKEDKLTPKNGIHKMYSFMIPFKNEKVKIYNITENDLYKYMHHKYSEEIFNELEQAPKHTLERDGIEYSLKIDHISGNRSVVCEMSADELRSKIRSVEYFERKNHLTNQK